MTRFRGRIDSTTDTWHFRSPPPFPPAAQHTSRCNLRSIPITSNCVESLFTLAPVGTPIQNTTVGESNAYFVHVCPLLMRFFALLPHPKKKTDKNQLALPCDPFLNFFATSITIDPILALFSHTNLCAPTNRDHRSVRWYSPRLVSNPPDRFKLVL